MSSRTVQIVSDLHVEFHDDDGAAMTRAVPAVGDVLVIAGDLVPAKWRRERLVSVLRQFTDRWLAVVLVAGNHEAYGLPIGLAEYNLHKAAEEAGAAFLANEAREVAGLRFFGGTGWFPDRSGSAIEWDARTRMADFRLVRGIEDDAPASNRLFDERLTGEAGAVDVVVSHHLPSRGCIDPRYAGSPLNAYFLADFEHLLAPTGAQLWVHGHTHAPVDLRVGSTRIVCNPHAYPRERALAGAYPTVTVEVQTKEPPCPKTS